MLAVALLLGLFGSQAQAQTPVPSTSLALPLERNLNVGRYPSEPFVIHGAQGPEGLPAEEQKHESGTARA